MNLPDSDHEYLSAEGISYRVFEDGGMLCVLLGAFPLPAGLNEPSVDVMLRLAALYPDAAPDMWWVTPALTTSGGLAIPGTEVTEIYCGRSWQRWSRHLEPGMWRAGVDGLHTFMALLRNELAKAARSAA
ncbi:E2/UBC family protein [Mycobacterium sp. GA-2829]|uniref:E2/UBC family protein n=1 Tax=Mycobacterium sp. GA-2829 TaxID=1772283 RepID=UPI00073FFED7|nr:E2/UBC family protein [Mycobacterium sp. GA-2829]KUI36459.1 hypothetical protein AU194_08200 [Mycobacterium sp. GA-2829]